MDESPDRREGAGVRLDNDRSQRHDVKIHNGGSNLFRIPKIPTSEQERLWLDPAIVSKEAAPLYSRYIRRRNDGMGGSAKVQLWVPF